MSSYAGKTLFVDLSTGKTRSEFQTTEDAARMIGGGGLNARLALELIPPHTDPLSPKNAIIIGAGPLVGTNLMSSPKTVLTTKGPLTGTILSTPAGQFGPSLRRAGFDQLVIQGRAPKPVYLLIVDNEVKLLPAEKLWGEDLFQTTDSLWQSHPNTTIACIGQAGENQVAFANILINKEATWCRGGPGAVMGSKNLKAIVVRGNGRVKVADKERFDALTKKCYAAFQAGPNISDWRKLGVFIAWDSFLETGAFGRNYYQSIYPKEEMTRLYGPEAYLAGIKKGSFACPSCPMACKQIIAVEKGEVGSLSMRSSCPFVGTESFGARGEVGSMEKVAKGLEMSNRYGIDNVTLLGMLDYIVDLYRKEKISLQDCRGFQPRLGFEAVMEFMDMVVKRKGLGEIVADGWKTVVEQLGKGDYQEAITIKGIEPTADLRAYLSTESFGKLTGHRGAHANRALAITQVPGRSPEALKRYGLKIGVPLEATDRVFSGPQGYSIPRLLKWVEDYNTMLTYLGLCNRAPISRVFDTETCNELFQAATGITLSSAELLKAGERIWNLEKLFNAREGFSRKDDLPPERWLREPLDFYGEQKPPLEVKEINSMLDQYYQERGWEASVGIPTKQSLEQLGLDNFMDYAPTSLKSTTVPAGTV